MFEKLKARSAFTKELSRPDITKAYALPKPDAPWYPTHKKVHESLAELRATYDHYTAEITSRDGLKLRAIVYPCTNQKPRGTVIFIHGYTSHAEREWAVPGLFYLSIGFNVIIPYQRAHGLSEGKYISFGAMEKFDMLGWIDFAKKAFPDCPTVIHGLSMGGGIALQLCDAENADIKGVIADGPSFGIKYTFKHISASFGEKHKNAIYDHLNDIFFKTFGVQASVTDVENHVRQSNCPILLTAGSMENREDNFKGLESICPKPVKIVILPGCNHGNGMYKQTELFQSEIKAFLSTLDL